MNSEPVATRRGAEWLTCARVRGLVVRFDPVAETDLGCHARGPARSVLAGLVLLQVDFGRVEGHVGVEHRHIPRPGDRNTVTSYNKPPSQHSRENRPPLPSAFSTLSLMGDGVLTQLSCTIASKIRKKQSWTNKSWRGLMFAGWNCQLVSSLWTGQAQQDMLSCLKPKWTINAKHE